VNPFLEAMLTAGVSNVRRVSILTDGTEPKGGGYARQPIVWVLGETAANKYDITWSLPKGVYDAIGYHNAAGELVASRELDPPLKMTRQGVVLLRAGKLAEALQ